MPDNPRITLSPDDLDFLIEALRPHRGSLGPYPPPGYDDAEAIIDATESHRATADRLIGRLEEVLNKALDERNAGGTGAIGGGRWA